MKHAFPFLVLTLLQLCRAETPNALPEWYAANLVNDANYSPKPLTEIFSTDPSFTFRNTDLTRTTTQVTTTPTPQPASSIISTNAPVQTSPSTKNYPSSQTQVSGSTNSTQTSGAANGTPILTISVKRKGSKTNVLINPTSTPKPTTTSRKSTRRNNNYEVCLDSCKNRKDPICGSPKGVTPVNPDSLKGFGSLCHMACHNTFRNQQYEKIADGRCGKLRTRIRPVDQNKLNRQELNKAQYDIVHNGDETLIQFAQLTP